MILPTSDYQGFLGTSSVRFYQVNSVQHFGSSYATISDKRFKNNFRKIDNPLQRLLQINGLKYDYINEDLDSITDEKEKEKRVKLLQNKLGFLAQEVEKVIPEAVVHDNDIDRYYIEYDAFIPVIIEAIKEMATELDQLKSNNLKSADLNSFNSQSDESAKLNQNIPNPFTENTRIDLYIPQSTNKANIYVYNMQGVQIKSFLLNERGNTSLTIEGSTLKAGMYMYTLIADGKEVDTKKMILTK